MKSRSGTLFRPLGLGLLAVVVVVTLVMVVPLLTTATPAPTRDISQATVVMQFPEAMGPMERPSVEFDHARHSAALMQEGCTACHPVDDKGLTPRLTATIEVGDRDSLVDAFHETCTGCHKQRAAASLPAGPLTCGECHARRTAGTSTRAPMTFDYSLHGRHAQAYPEKCDPCHHVYDEAEKVLKYEKDKEEACHSCHGAEDEERKLSLANASHRACISCHLGRVRDELEAGPVLCVGCHDPEHRRGMTVLEEIPRLVRGQPDTCWIVAADARSRTVSFNHKAHEPLTTSCSTCHHQTLKPCKDCHTLMGAEAGAGITLAQAYHAPASGHSCVGCHQGEIQEAACSGCHHVLTQPPGPRSCAICHDGLQPGPSPFEAPPPVPAEVALAALPSTSDDYPETVVIDALADRYEPSTLPHAKIVGKLDAAVRESALAGRFHAATDTLCSGCHHESPMGTRPPPCRACHGDAAEAVLDMPDLKVAYHRQCLGCHLEMGIDKQGCTDCHASKEVQP